MSNLNVKKFKNIIDKQKYLNNIRHEIKKKRFFLDEGKDKFGMDEMTQLIKVKNTSNIKGYPFAITKKNYKDKENVKIAIKIVPIEIKYEKDEHPCNLENLILKELTENIVNKNISPHITHYLGTQKVNNKNKALKQLNLKRLEVEGKIRTHSNMLISEYVNAGSLDNWIFNIYENDMEISDYQWKSIVFQLIYTISIFQHYYRLMHNDFHYGNILIDDTIENNGYLVYEINNKKFYIKNTGIVCKVWDFEFGMVYSDNIKGCYANKFITGPYKYDSKNHQTIIDEELYSEIEEYPNVPYNYNEYYDLHYFLTSLLDLYISQDLFDWIMKIYPEEVIPEEESSTNSNSTNILSDTSTNESGTSNNTIDNQSDSYNTSNDTYSDISSDFSDTYSESSNDSVVSDLSKLTLSSKSSYKKYVHEGRLINGVENMFSLPTVKDLINSDFFNEFTIKPHDFDDKTAIYFKAGF
jgi:hypothetical protein